MLKVQIIMGQHTDFHGSKRKVNQYSRHTFITKRQRCALFNVLASAAPCATKAGGSKLAALELWPPYAGYLQNRMILLWVLLAIFMDREIMEQKPLEFNLCLEKTIEFHGVRTGHPAVRVGFLLDITSHRQGDEATPLTSTCWAAWHPKGSLLWNTYEAVSENGVYIYIYMMVYIYDGIPGIRKKKRPCSWGEYDDIQKKKKTIRFWGTISSHIHTVAYNDPRIDI